MKKILLSALLASAFFSVSQAAPTTVTSMTGDFRSGGHVAITGTNYDTKTPAAPYFWSSFDSGVSGSTFGVVSSISLANMAWTSTEGHLGGGIKATNDTGNWTALLDGITWLSTNDKFHISKRERWNFLITSASQNWKNYRLWAIGGLPNLYFSASNGRAFVEYVGGSDSGFWSNFNPETTNWTFQQIFVKASSANDVQDGELTFRVDGIQKASGAIKTKGATVNADMVQNYVVHGVLANKPLWSPAWDPNWRLWADDIYADNTWQSVDVCDSAVYANCRKFGRVIPTAWTPTSVNGVLYLPNFTNGETAYVHVFNKNRESQTSGYAFTVSGSVAGDPPPTLSAISHSTGTTGTNVTLTGDNFLEPLTIRIGSNETDNEVRVSSTKANFTVANCPAGQTFDVTLFNVNGLSATLGGAFTCASASAGNPPPDPNIISLKKAFPAFRQ